MQILCDDTQATVTFPKIACTGYDASDAAHTKQDVTVVIQLDSSSGKPVLQNCGPA